jgi:DNA-binding LacI/PurR family transcriptional regulator
MREAKKPMVRVSSNDVARLAGVSRSTVSRVFTEGGYASPAIRDQVMSAARLLGYSPNAIARSLITRRSDLVGVIVGELENPFHAGVLQFIAEALQRNGRTSLLFVAPPEEIDSLIPQVLAYQVDAVILTGATLSTRMAIRCQDAGIPVALVNRYIDSDVVTSVVGDNVDGAAQVGRHLAEQGFRRIAFMAGLATSSSTRDREHGLLVALNERGLKVHSRDVGHYQAAGGTAAAVRLLDRADRPDAIFCANDVMAAATVDVARSRFGLRVPGDLAVAGYDNSPIAGMAAYQLTSVEQNMKAMAETAVELLRGGKGKLLPAQVLKIPAQLCLRTSTLRG